MSSHINKNSNYFCLFCHRYFFYNRMHKELIYDQKRNKLGQACKECAKKHKKRLKTIRKKSKTTKK